MHNTGFFPDCCLLSVTDGCIWIPYLARYYEIFKKPNFQVVKCKSTFISKMLSQAELETEWSDFATIFGLPPTPRWAGSTQTWKKTGVEILGQFWAFWKYRAQRPGSLATQMFGQKNWNMILTPKCRGKPDLYVCMTSVLAKRMRPHSHGAEVGTNTFLDAAD